MSALTSLVLSALVLLVSGEKIRYDGYTVKRITPQTEEQLALLVNLEYRGANFWHHPTIIGRHADVLLSPSLQGEVLQSLRTSGLKIENFVEDVQKLIDEQETSEIQPKGNKMDWTSYNSLEEINAYLVQQWKKHPDTTELFSIGKSTEGRDLWVLKIATGGETNKKSIWLDANIHAREWITSAVATFTINELLNGDRKGWTEDFDWYILTVVNPDGFVYTKTTNRLWRKTRSVGNGNCNGTDANRNFDIHWMENGGASANPCAETYAGKKPFSEPETIAIANFITTISKNLVAYISLHSYSQLILLPFGHNNNHIPQYEAYMNLGERIAKATAASYGTQFTPGNIVDMLYVATGCSMDWVKATFNTNLTLTYEMRDIGQYGFLLPPAQIIPSAKEFLDGFYVAMESLRVGIITPDFLESSRSGHPKRELRVPSIVPYADHNTFGEVPHARHAASPLASFHRF